MARVLIVSGHDYRSPRWANMHFIARDVVRRGDRMRFFSLGFSLLSALRGDPRLSLAERANRVETVDGVECFLWKTVWHPIRLRPPPLDALSPWLFRAYHRRLPRLLQEWVADSDTIILESGMAPILMAQIAQLQPQARLIYLASDLLPTIGVDPFVQAELEQHIAHFAAVVIPSRRMAAAFPPAARLRYVPHGLDVEVETIGPSPYGDGIHAVSVGSMLFDADFFIAAATRFPQVTFHVIGGGKAAAGLSAPNIKVYGEMPYARTLAYLKHARFGIAPYRADGVATYLCDTSMKLMQYGYFGVPAVCPAATVGDQLGRFGYDPADPDSITRAIDGAMGQGAFTPPPVLSWAEVTARILNSQDYPDTIVTR